MPAAITKMTTVKSKIKKLSVKEKTHMLIVLADIILDQNSGMHRDDLVDECIENIEIWSNMNLDHFKSY
jgi:hypothetical protein